MQVVIQKLKPYLTWHTAGILWGTITQPLLRLAVMAIAARILSTHDFGIFTYLYSIAVVASVFSDLGMRNTIYSECGRVEDSKLSDYIAKLLGLRAWLFLVSLLGMACYLILLKEVPTGIALLMALVGVNMYLADPGVQLLRGKALSQFEPLAFGLQFVLLIGLLAGLDRMGQANLHTVAAAFAGTALLRLAYTTWQVHRRICTVHFAFSIRSSLHQLKGKLLPGLILVAWMFFLRLPILSAEQLQDTSLLAGLGILFSLIQFALGIPNALSNILIPLMLRRNAQADPMTLFVPKLVLCFVGGAVIAVILFGLARPLLGIFGSDYTSLVDPFRLLLISMPFLCVNQGMRLLNMARPCFVATAVVISVAVVFRLGLFHLFGLDNGMHGIVQAVIISEITLALLLVFPMVPTGLRAYKNRSDATPSFPSPGRE